MDKLLKNIYFYFEKLYDYIPEDIKLRLSPEKYSIINFMKFSSKNIKKNSLLLDAGAGRTPYKKYFSHTIYNSCDFSDIFHQDSLSKHNFICDLENIPVKNETYDVIINTQVLEHVKRPSKVLDEFNRILKKDGELYITIPQGWGLHGEPYHYFNFTYYGIKLLLEEANFEIKFIKEKGGFFWYLSERIKELPHNILFQHLFKRKNNRRYRFRPTITGFLLIPFYLAIIPFTSFLLPLIFFYLDKLDKEKKFTLGYVCYCIKK